jgi:hypothetical protein
MPACAGMTEKHPDPSIILANQPHSSSIQHRASNIQYPVSTLI